MTKGNRLMKANASDDDRNLLEHGRNDSHYWYSVSDGFRLVLWLRKHYLNYDNLPQVQEGEQFVAYRENNNHIFVTNLYHSSNFSSYLEDDINRITATGEFNAFQTGKWAQMPTTIIILLLSGLHWRVVKISINYNTKTAQILFDDPYGSEAFPEYLKSLILDAVKQNIENLIRSQNGDNDFELAQDQIATKDKSIDQQGQGENSWDCGPVTFSNIEDYVKSIVENNPLIYTIPVHDNPEHGVKIVDSRTQNIAHYGEVIGLALDEEMLNGIKQALKNERKEKVKKLETLSLDLDFWSSLLIDKVFVVLENNRLYGNTRNTRDYTDEELKYAHGVVLNELVRSQGALSQVKFKTSKNYTFENLTGEVLSKKEYNELLDIIDILRIEKIIEEIEAIKEIDNLDSNSLFFRYRSTSAIKGVDEVESDRIQSYVKAYKSVAKNISLLSKHEGSVKNYFTNFPWYEVEQTGYLLNNAIKEGDISLYKKYKEIFAQDLEEFKIRLDYIVQAVKLGKPKVGQILDSSSNIERSEILAEIYNGLDFVHPDDSKSRGLKSIRKTTELGLDKDKQEKILELISKAEAFNSELPEGRAALFGITTMICEISKDVSVQTKLLNSTIPFQQLRDFRNKIHDMDVIAKAKKLLECVETNKEIFLEIKVFLVSDLRSKISSLVIPSLEVSSPQSPDNPLPPISYLDPDSKIKDILGVIKQAFPQEIRTSERVQLKLGICEDILSGRLIIPFFGKPGYNLQNLFLYIFKDELAGAKTFSEAFYKHHDGLATKSHAEIGQDIKILKNLDKNKIYIHLSPSIAKDPSQEVECLKKFEQVILPSNSASSSEGHTKEQKESYYIEKQLEILINSLEKINQSTQSVMNDVNDYQGARLVFSDP